MSTKYEYRVSTPGVVGGRKVIDNDGFISLASDNTSDPASVGKIAYVSGTGFRAYGANGVFTIGSGGTGGISGGLNDSYSNGQSITMAQGPITLTDATAAALNTLVLTKSGAGSGNVLDLNLNAVVTGNAIDIDMDAALAAKGIYIDDGGGVRTGSDLQINDDSTGAHSNLDINKSGYEVSSAYITD